MPTLKELTDAAGIEHVVWLDDLFDNAPRAAAIADAVDLRELVARVVQRGLEATIAGHTLGPDLTVDEWMAELADLQQDGVADAEIRAPLSELLNAGAAPEQPDYSDAAIQSILTSFGAGMVEQVGL